MNNIDNVKSESWHNRRKHRSHLAGRFSQSTATGDNTPLIERQTGEYAQALDIARNSIG
jgi:hypothetical protein